MARANDDAAFRARADDEGDRTNEDSRELKRNVSSAIVSEPSYDYIDARLGERDGGGATKRALAESESRSANAKRAESFKARAKAEAQAGIANVPRGSATAAKFGVAEELSAQEKKRREEEEERVEAALRDAQKREIEKNQRNQSSRKSRFDNEKLETFLKDGDKQGNPGEFDDDEEDDPTSAKYTDEDDHKSWFVMHPTNKMRQWWDFLQVFLLVYIAISVPYRLGFSELAYGYWYAIDFIVDSYFYVDMVFNFFTAYWEVSDADDDYHYVTNLYQIQKHYVKGWFLLDLISLIPVDYIARAIDGTASCSWESEQACGDAAQSSKVPEALRLLRLLRLLRMARTSRILERYQEVLLRVYKTVTIVRLVVILILLAHFMGCLYAYFYNFQRDDASGVDGLKGEMYVAALFWSVQTLTTVGYGNVVPTTVDERLVAIVVMITGGFVFSAIISGVNMSMDEDSPGNRFAVLMNHVRELLLEHKMPAGLKSRVRSHYRNSAKAPKLVNRDIIQPLPESIRADVNFYIYGAPLLKGLIGAGRVEPDGIVIELICRTMDTVVYQRGTRVCYPYELAEKLIITLSGRISYSADEATGYTYDTASKIKRKKLREQQTMIAEEKGWLRGPGTVLNPGLICGFHKGILCAVPFDKSVEALALDHQAFLDMLTLHQPKLIRNFIDEFLNSLFVLGKPKMTRIALSESNMREFLDETTRLVCADWRELVQEDRDAEDKAEVEAAKAGALAMVKGLSFKSKDGGVDKGSPGATIGAIKLAMQQMHADIVQVSEQVAQVMISARETRDIVTDLGLNSNKILMSSSLVEEKQETMEINVEAVYQAVQNLATASANMEAGGWSRPGVEKQTFDFTRGGGDSSERSKTAGIAPFNPMQQDAIREKIAEAAKRGRKLTITTNVETEQQTWDRERVEDVGIQGIRRIPDRATASRSESSKHRVDKTLKDSL